MEVDRSRADEELGRDITVGQPLSDQPGDLELLGGQLGWGVRARPTDRLPRGSKLLTRSLRPGPRIQVVERGQRSPQVSAGVDPVSATTQELAVGQLCPGPFEWPPTRLVLSQTLPVVLTCLIGSRQESAAVGGPCRSPGGACERGKSRKFDQPGL